MAEQFCIGYHAGGLLARRELSQKLTTGLCAGPPEAVFSCPVAQHHDMLPRSPTATHLQFVPILSEENIG